MSKFKGSSENGYTFVSNDNYEIPLDQENLTGIFFREEEWYDRICVLDPRDSLHFAYWRDQVDKEVFDQVCDIAWAVGTVLLRDSAPDSIVSQWDNDHHMSEEEFEQFFGEGHEQL